MLNVALDLVKQNGGVRQMERALIENISMQKVAKKSIHQYPFGYYIKKRDAVIEIYEKYISAGWIMNTICIHKIKVISIIEIELDDNMKLKCDRGTLHKSIYNCQPIVPFMNELKLVLMQRKMKMDELDSDSDEEEQIEEKVCISKYD